MAESVRALITNRKDEAYLVIHNYVNPKNTGKWSTVGGLRDETDFDEVACLTREIEEEFGAGALEQMTIGRKISTVRRTHETSGKSVDYHFYQVSFAGDELLPTSPEIIKGAFLPFSALADIKAEGKLFFDVEDSLYAEALR